MCKDMKTYILIFVVFLMPSTCFSGEKIEKIEVFGKTQFLPNYCELRLDNEESLSISCVPPDNSNIVNIYLMKSYDCKEEIIKSKAGGYDPNKSELVNTTVNGIWYYESTLYSPNSGITLYSRNIYDGKDCLQVSSGKNEVLDGFTSSLWL